VAEDAPDSARDRLEGGTQEDGRRAFVLDARAELLRLSPRDRAIVVAAALGEEREDIARNLGTSRANVDQIVSRARKRLSGGEP
jgi:DNA-directed RNA polymerase specialized sigma24 family protein